MSQREAFEAFIQKVSPLTNLTLDAGHAYVNGRIEFGWMVWQAAIAHTVPPGHVVVPIEPSAAMLDVAVSHALNVSLSSEYNWTRYMTDIWARMIAAAQGAKP